MVVRLNRSTIKQVQTFTEDLGLGIELTMVLIPPGEFWMGSLPKEKGHQDRESPRHRVKISQPFFMGQYPVTQAQWQRVAKMPQVARKLDVNPSHFKGADLPVEQVSWNQAQEFCARLSNHSHRRYQLPTEAAWEYACRAGMDDEPFHFGSTISTEIANYNGNYIYGEGEQGEYRQKTTPVGGFGVANAFGLYDMHGNVWEWCEDSWHDNYNGAPTDGSDWVDSGSSSKILRGGSWFVNPDNCRSAYRYRYSFDYLSSDWGFRVMYAPARTP